MLKKLFSKTSFIIFLILLGLAVFFYGDWFKKQYHKGIGVYDVYLGDKAFHKGELQDAIDLYNKGLELYPEHYSAWFNLGNIYVKYEDYYAAADAYRNAINYNPKYTAARMNLGIISTEKLGDFNGAIEQYQAIIDSKKFLWFIPFVFSNSKSEKINRGLAYYNMGVAYREKSLYEDSDREHSSQYLLNSIKAYKNAARILKNDYDTRYNLALAYHLAGDYQNAGINYCKAIELEPMNYESHYNLAILLRHLKMYKEALTELEKATILVSNDGDNSNNTIYIFDVLNEVSKTLAINNEYRYLVEKVDDEQATQDMTYVNGKIVPTEALDRAMLKNFKTCDTLNFFKKY